MMSMSGDLDELRRQVSRHIKTAYITGYKVGVQDQKGSWDRFEAWEKLSQVYQMKGLPDLAYSIIGDVMRCLDVPDAEEPKKCDTCKHEKERWFSRCADCSDYELWESKE